ncbi:MAG: F0F1 ATP synthase subunit A [Opitutales bacterium]|nr:F0F1 ATP synthase subunit A [Opitutales bacterium]
MGFIKFSTLFTILAGFFASANKAQAAHLQGEYLFDIAGFPITNSMLTTWIFTLIIIVFFRFLIRGGAKLVPSKGQLVVESIIDALKGTLEPIMGHKTFKGAFPLLIGLFCYILIMNWSGLLPGVASIGIEQTINGKEHFVPFLRPANTDLNTTLALAIISFVAWGYLVFKYAGPKLFLYDTFGNKANPSEMAKPIYIALFAVFFAVGGIDIISMIMRLISLSFRLFGNNFGGEVLLDNMHNLAIGSWRFLSWLIPLPFYLLEMLIGFIQAFLFTLLTAVYVGLLTGHEEH